MSIKKAVIILAILAAVFSLVMFFMVKNKGGAVYSTAKVERGVLIQTVSETGTLKSANEINLSFFSSGRISSVFYKVGDKIEKDSVVAELDYSALLIKKTEASANLEAAKHSLNRLVSGATREDIEVVEAEVSMAKASYEAYKRELEKTKQSADETVSQAQKTLLDLESDTPADITTYEQAISSAQTSLDNIKTTYRNSINNQIESALVAVPDKIAVGKTALDKINRILTDEDADSLLSVTEPEHLAKTTQAYAKSLELTAQAEAALSAAGSAKTDSSVLAAVDAGLAAENKVFETLKSCFAALENSVTSSDFTLAELSAFKTDVSSQQSLVSAAVSSLQSSRQGLEGAVLAYDTNVSTASNNLAKAKADYEGAVLSAKNALATARATAEQQITAVEARIENALESWQVASARLKAVKAPANSHDVALSKAKVRQAEAILEDLNKQIENFRIISPISGLVTRMKYEVGEQVPQGAHMASVLAEDDFEVEVLISEADIVKIKVGNEVEMTLDSFSDDIKFKGNVSFIEPAETIIQDVIYYKVKIAFDPGQEKVKSGMTANAKIRTASRENVLLVQSRAVIEKNGDGKFVRVLEGSSPVMKKVETGLRGDDGQTEILGGVNEGDLVITHITEK